MIITYHATSLRDLTNTRAQKETARIVPKMLPHRCDRSSLPHAGVKALVRTVRTRATRGDELLLRGGQTNVRPMPDAAGDEYHTLYVNNLSEKIPQQGACMWKYTYPHP